MEYPIWLIHPEYVILIDLPWQKLLRERIALLRHRYSASSVPYYVRYLCTCTLCSVYRVPSVILCSSALILQSLAVTAVRFELRYQFNKRALRAPNQYTCTNTYRTNWRLRRNSVETLFIFSAKRFENIWLKTVESEMSQRKTNEHLDVTLWVRELGWSALLGVWKCKSLRGKTVMSVSTGR